MSLRLCVLLDDVLSMMTTAGAANTNCNELCNISHYLCGMFLRVPNLSKNRCGTKSCLKKSPRLESSVRPRPPRISDQPLDFAPGHAVERAAGRADRAADLVGELASQ